jgi:ABC-2 type transport system permease protein
MIAIYLKEINSFFSSLIGYIVIAVFLVILGLVLFVFPDTSLLNYPFASLDQLFGIAPMIFLFLIPAVTMRAFSEEYQQGTIELLRTKPVTDWAIVLGKYLASLSLVVFALLPTLLYYYTVYDLGTPRGNLDSGAILGSYIGLFFLAAAFTGIGVFASALLGNQIFGFILATFLCFLLYYGFYFFSQLPIFVGKGDDLVEKLGIDFHYESISRGVLDSRDVIYFLSVSIIFLLATLFVLERKKS